MRMLRRNALSFLTFMPIAAAAESAFAAPRADREAAEEVTGGMRMEQKVIFNGQVFTLTRFWATEEPCLRITDPQQIEMPKMELVGAPR